MRRTVAVLGDFACLISTERRVLQHGNDCLSARFVLVGIPGLAEIQAVVNIVLLEERQDISLPTEPLFGLQLLPSGIVAVGRELPERAFIIEGREPDLSEVIA